MGWIIGVDEAGYGPNLGPLAIAATAWRVDGPPKADLYELLSAAVSREPDRERITLADSKRLYAPGKGLRLLERGVWSALSGSVLVGPPSWAGLLTAVDADPDGRRNELPWHAGFDPPLPVDADEAELAASGEQLRSACVGAGVGMPMVRARLVFPAEFNALTDRYGTKGAALSHTTLALLRVLIDQCGGDGGGDGLADGPVRVTLDKHGGRNRYAALLQHHFAEHWIDTQQESRAVSRYAWGPADRRVEAAFQTGGEEHLPAALASMTAKYLRELSMRALNEFWRAKLPDLKRTAGYPVDAKRFKQAIAAKQRTLKIEDNVLWRNR